MGDTDFFGRVGELESLQDAYDSRIAEMAIIYGHRRIGKTALIQKFCEGKPAFFYTAKAWKDPYQLDRFSQAVGTFCGNPQLRYLEWTSALRALAAQPSPSRKVIVIDEFQYIAKERPSILSELQVLWDEELSWDEGTKNGPDRSALLGHNFVYQETKPHGFYSSYFHQRISS